MGGSGNFLLLGGAGLCLALTAVHGIRWSRHTSLIAAWKWLLAVEAGVVLMTATDFVAGRWPGRTEDYGWCLMSILLLCPPMAVLGARRPGAAVWTWFILVPMVLVLSWPVWTLWLQGSELRGLALEWPTVLGFTLVLAMSAGNFLSRRWAFPAAFYAIGTAGLFLSCSGWEIIPELDLSRERAKFVLCLELAVVVALWKGRNSGRRHPVNRLWDDFRAAFGIVWGLRMVERINALALQEQWTIRMTFDGFPETNDGRITANEPKVTAACRWLFRRFVDDEWINERLGN